MEKFFLKIDATSTDDNHIDSTTEANIECSGAMVFTVLLNFFEKEKELRQLFEQALTVLKKKEVIDDITMN